MRFLHQRTSRRDTKFLNRCKIIYLTLRREQAFCIYLKKRKCVHSQPSEPACSVGRDGVYICISFKQGILAQNSPEASFLPCLGEIQQLLQGSSRSQGYLQDILSCWKSLTSLPAFNIGAIAIIREESACRGHFEG